MFIQLTSAPLDADGCARAVRTDASGAIVLFYGVVRNHNDGRAVLFLEYEAYPELAERQMTAVAEEIQQRFPVHAVAIAHRTGRLEIGETSLIVAVSSAHRADAFEACHAAVDRIKATVPVWKKEHWAGGGVWLEGTPVDLGLQAAP
ncbi:MAG: molybdenum cofactor biosynthesis protein MoaE [Dehalococcoidia bacterium]